jgi:hypothetical protein
LAKEQSIYLVSCVGKKRGSAVAAKDLYVYEWFLRARAYVEAMTATDKKRFLFRLQSGILLVRFA